MAWSKVVDKSKMVMVLPCRLFTKICIPDLLSGKRAMASREKNY